MASDNLCSNGPFLVSEEPRWEEPSDEILALRTPAVETDAPPTQFKLKSLLLTTAGVSVLFAVLRWLADSPVAAIGGPAVSLSVAYFSMRCISKAARPLHRAERAINHQLEQSRVSERARNAAETIYDT